MQTERVIQMEARLESERIKVEDLRRICDNADDDLFQDESERKMYTI